MRKPHWQAGFSAIEMMTVLVVLTIGSAVAVLSIGSALRSSHVQTAYETTIMQLRAARQMAVDQRVVTIVTLSTPGTIRTDVIRGGVTSNVVQLTLPSDVAFDAEPGIPNTTATTPDGFGLGNNAIDFDLGFTSTPVNVIYFFPDGSAQDTNGNYNNGVAYIAHPGDMKGSRAVTLFGATGRVRGWTLVKNSLGAYAWQ